MSGLKVKQPPSGRVESGNPARVVRIGEIREIVLELLPLPALAKANYQVGEIARLQQTMRGRTGSCQQRIAGRRRLSSARQDLARNTW